MWILQVEELARKVCEEVHENEPGVLQYRWFRAGGTEKPVIVVWETYALSTTPCQRGGALRTY